MLHKAKPRSNHTHAPTYLGVLRLELAAEVARLLGEHGGAGAGHEGGAARHHLQRLGEGVAFVDVDAAGWLAVWRGVGVFRRGEMCA